MNRPSTEFYYWRAPGVSPIQLSGAATANNVRVIYGGSLLSPMGNYLVGERQRESTPSTSGPVLWKMPLANGTVFAPVTLTPPPGVALPYSPTFHVNDYGFVVATGTYIGKKAAILWKINPGGDAVSASILPLPQGGVSSSVTGISNEPDPLIVGRSMIGNVDEKATAWRGNGALENLNIPPNVGFSAAATVSPNGRVAGTCRLMQEGVANYRIFTSTRNPTTSAWKFQVHGDPVLAAEILSINDDGEIFGNSTTAFGQAWTKFLWRHGRGHALDQVIPAHTGHQQSQISALNAHGTLLATTFKDGAAMTVILTPDSDTDGDGLPDAWENQYDLDPFAKNTPATDSDSDILSDLEEFRNGTKPNNPDSDGDGMKDGWEISWGFLPLDPSDAALDPDNDHVANLRESQIGTTPTGIYQVSHRYTDAASLGPILHSDDFGNLVFTGPWDLDYGIDPNGLNIAEMGYQRWLLPAQAYDVLPVLRDGEFEYMDYWLRMWEQDSYGTNPLTGEVFGWLTRSNWYDPVPDAPYFVPSGGTFLIPDVATNVEVPPAWNSWANLESNLRDPNQHNGNVPLGPNETLTISWPDAISSSGARRIIRSSAGESFVINETGGFETKLLGLAQWKAVNDLGLAIRTEITTIPTTGGSPSITISEMFLSTGDSFLLDLPPGASPFVTIVSLSDDGNALLSTPVLNSQLNSTIQYFLVDTTTGTLARIRTPGLGYESITKLSTTQARILGNGSKPFQIAPDGTCIRLEALRIKNLPSDTPVPFGPQTITPIHITPDGTITVSTTNSPDQTQILNIVPHNDADNDGVPDDWEIAYNSPNGTGDQDGDELIDADEFANGTNPNNADSDEDGIPDGWELQNGLNPNDPADTAKIGPVNLGFDEEINDSPDLSFRPVFTSDLYGQESIPGWKSPIGERVPGWRAPIGQHIEVWNESEGEGSEPGGDKNPYIELQSHLGAHGAKQKFHMLPGSRLSFILRYKGRYPFEPYDNSFTLKVENASELYVNGTLASTSGGVMSHPFMEDDEWDKYSNWRYATILITAPSGGSFPTAVTLSLVPQTTTAYGVDGENEITHGGFVDLLPSEFRDVTGRINYGFDPPLKGLPTRQPPVPDDAPGEMPWASAVRGRASDNQNVKFVLPEPLAAITELKIVSGSADLSLDPHESALSASETTLTLKGLNPTNRAIAYAEIEAQLVSDSKKLTAMNVMVLPERTVSLGIYRVTDPNSAGTAPINDPGTAAILDALKEIYKQAGITFEIAGAGDRPVNYDTDADGKVQDNELMIVSAALENAPGKVHIYLLKNSGKAYDEDSTKFQRAKTGVRNDKPYCALYVDTIVGSGGTVERIAAHEMGHAFEISVRNGDEHDSGPFPKHLGTDGLMKSGAPESGILPPEPGPWLPHEDWKEANDNAERYE